MGKGPFIDKLVGDLDRTDPEQAQALRDFNARCEERVVALREAASARMKFLQNLPNGTIESFRALWVNADPLNIATTNSFEGDEYDFYLVPCLELLTDGEGGGLEEKVQWMFNLDDSVGDVNEICDQMRKWSRGRFGI